MYEYDGLSSGLSDALFFILLDCITSSRCVILALLGNESYGSVVCICEGNLFLVEPGQWNSHLLVEEARCFTPISLAQLEPSRMFREGKPKSPGSFLAQHQLKLLQRKSKPLNHAT